jgi:hypothetical protein
MQAPAEPSPAGPSPAGPSPRDSGALAPQSRIGAERAPEGPHKVSFLGHEIAEYALGVGLLVVGFQVSGRLAPPVLAGGVILLLLGALSKGVLGLVGLIGPGLHRAVDVVLGLGLLASPLLLLVVAPRSHGTGLDPVGLIAVEVAGVALLRMVQRTSYRGRPVSRLLGGSDPPASRAPASAPAPLGRGARSLGRLAGQLHREAAAGWKAWSDRPGS